MADEVKDKANMFYLVIVSIVAVVAIVSMVVFFAGTRMDSGRMTYWPSQAKSAYAPSSTALSVPDAALLMASANGSGDRSGNGSNLVGHQFVDAYYSPNTVMYYASYYGYNQVDVNAYVYCNMYLVNAEQSAVNCDAANMELYINLGTIYCGSLGQSVNVDYYHNHYANHCPSEFNCRLYPSLCK
jgi:hypothetical protein